MKTKSLLTAAFALLAVVAAGSLTAAADAKHEMTAQDLQQRLKKGEKVVIVDARHELNGQIVKGAVHVPDDKLKEWASAVDKTTVIVTYCTCPHDEAAEEEVQQLQSWGYKNAYSLKGGLNAARAAGILVVPPEP